MVSTSKAQEKNLERSFCEQVKPMGCEALKFQSPYSTGWPDRFVLSPWGKLYLAEFKTEGRKLTPKQEVKVKKARKMGFTVFVVDSREALKQSVEQIKSDYEIFM